MEEAVNHNSIHFISFIPQKQKLNFYFYFIQSMKFLNWLDGLKIIL